MPNIVARVRGYRSWLSPCLPHMVALEGFYRPLRESYSPTALLRFWLPEGEAIAVVDARATGDESSASGSSQGNLSISLQACLKAAS